MGDPSDQVARPGVLLEGRYRLGEVLGEGSAGIVLSAEDERLGRTVAVKVLRGGEALADPGRFSAEARILAGLRHPKVVEVLDYGVFQDAPFLVMELLPGGSLRTRLAHGPLTVSAAVVLAHDLLEALGAAHRLDVLHRDVKPENIFLAEDGSARLGDFGLARSLGATRATADGILLGTPHYMAPEVLWGEPAGPASDLFAWATVVFEASVGRTLRTGVLSDWLRLPEVSRADLDLVPVPLRAAVEAALAVRPEARPGIPDLALLLPLPGASDLSPRPAVPQAQAGPGATVLLDPRPEAGVPVPPSSPRSSPMVVVALVSMLLGLGVGLLLGAPGPRPEVPVPDQAPASASTGAEAGEPEPGDEGGLDLWAIRLGPYDATRLLARAHRDMGGDLARGESYSQWMANARRHGLPVEVESVLAHLIEELPLRSEVVAAHAELTRLLARPGPGSRRLAACLVPLAHVDAFFEAWGRPAPYGVQLLLQSFWKLRVVPWAPPPKPSPRHRIFEWTDPRDREHPILVPHHDVMHLAEKAIVDGVEFLSGDSWSSAAHQRIEAVVPPGRSRPRVLVVTFSTLLARNVLRIGLGDDELVVHGSPATDPEGTWNTLRSQALGAGWWQVRIELPAEIAPPGLPVDLTVGPLPGLPAWGGVRIDSIDLE